MKGNWQVLPAATDKIWSLLSDWPGTRDFYLAGGTGLALYLGHRISRDLDFFTPDTFNPSTLVQKLGMLGTFQLELTGEQTVVGILNETKLSFLGYKYPLLDSVSKLRGIQVANITDIACMKLDAIASRGTKRDFIDLFFIAQSSPLIKILKLFQKKYATINYNLLHVKKSLVYFADADFDPMPEMLKPVEWAEVKSFFENSIQKF